MSLNSHPLISIQYLIVFNSNSWYKNSLFLFFCYPFFIFTSLLSTSNISQTSVVYVSYQYDKMAVTCGHVFPKCTECVLLLDFSWWWVEWSGEERMSGVEWRGTSGECRMAGMAVAAPTFPLPHQHFSKLALLSTPKAQQTSPWPHELWKQSSTHGDKYHYLGAHLEVRCW